MAASPIAQFEIRPIVPIEVMGVDLSFTNSALFMVLAVAAASAFLIVATRRPRLVPGRLQAAAEMLHDTVAGMVRDNVGSGGRRFFPFIFSLFLFILAGNLLGMIPHGFTFTSHLIVTGAMAITVFLGVVAVGVVKNGAGFLRTFLPRGAPLWTAVILIPVEIISFLARPVSLAVRLFAAMTAGHLLLKVIAGGIVAMGVFGVFPLAMLVALTAFEVFVAVLQAYIFTILACVYLHDALHPH